MSHSILSDKVLVYEYLVGIEPICQNPAWLRRYFSEGLRWHGCAPFDTQTGTDALWQVYWRTLHGSFSHLRRRIDLFLGGECEGQSWVSSAGYIIGQFDEDWLGIPASGRETFIRYGEFYQVENSRIVRVYLLHDLLDVMRQAGCYPLPPSLGLFGFVPPPRTADGILRGLQPPAESELTFKLAYDMLFCGLNEFDRAGKQSMGMRRFWHEDMHWYGPAGIGTTRSLTEFEDYHQLPWLRAFPDRAVVWESPMFGDGRYAATAGWREVIATHTGEYLGQPPTHKRIEFRVMDWWRREGERLIENWVLIDMIDLFRQFGRDLLAGLPQKGKSGRS